MNKLESDSAVGQDYLGKPISPFTESSARKRFASLQHNIPLNKDDVLGPNTSCAKILSQPALVISHEKIHSFSNAKKLIIYDVYGQPLGSMSEKTGFTAALSRGSGSGRRFKLTVYDLQGKPLLIISKKKTFFSSEVQVKSVEGKLIGESHEEISMLRRRYKLISKLTQFGKIDAPTLSRNFEINDNSGKLVASINREYLGFAKEVFTKAGMYAIRMDPHLLYSQQSHMPNSKKTSYSPQDISTQLLSLDERAVVLANAILIDFDYYTHES